MLNVLNQLVEHGLVKKVLVPGDCERFDKTLHNHNHMCCQICYNVYDIFSFQRAKLRQKSE